MNKNVKTISDSSGELFSPGLVEQVRKLYSIRSWFASFLKLFIAKYGEKALEDEFADIDEYFNHIEDYVVDIIAYEIRRSPLWQGRIYSNVVDSNSVMPQS